MQNLTKITIVSLGLLASVSMQGAPNVHTIDILHESAIDSIPESLLDQYLDEVVVTGTRTPKLLKDAPVITRLITADDIKKVDANNVMDLLQAEIPGIEFGYAMNQQVSLNLQGFAGNSVLFLVDGERLAGETMDNVDYSRLNLDNVERIEIVKGASSTLYGSNAVGGVINIITKKNTESWSANLNARIGKYNEQRYGGSLGLQSGKVNSLTNVQYTYQDNIPLGVGDFSEIYGNKTWNLKERLIYSPTQHLKLTGRLGYFFRQRNSAETSKERYRDYSAGLKGLYTFNDRADLEVAYAFDQYDKSDYVIQSGLDIRDYSNVQNSVRTLFNYKFKEKHTLTLGGDLMHDYLSTYQFKDNGSQSQYTFDAFAQVDYNPSSQWNILGALRYDYFSEASMSNVTARVSGMFKTRHCSLRGSYAGGFRAPSLKEMYMNFNMANIFMIYGNKDLKPEKSHNFSLSAEYTKSRYNVVLTGFCNFVENRMTTAWNSELNGMRYINMKNVRINGIDASASAKYPCGIGVRLSYVFTHESIKKGEPTFTDTRPHTATMRLDYGRDWKNYGFNVALYGRLLSALDTNAYTSATSYEETSDVHYPGYTIWKLAFSQKIKKGIHVNVTVDNLLNYRPSYYYANSPTTTGTTVSAGVSLDLEKLF